MVRPRTLRILNPQELHSPVEQKKRDLFDELFTAKWTTSLSPPLKYTPDSEFEHYDNEDKSPRVIIVPEDPFDCSVKAINTA